MLAGQLLTRGRDGGLTQPAAQEVEESEQNPQRGQRACQASPQGEVGHPGIGTNFSQILKIAIFPSTITYPCIAGPVQIQRLTLQRLIK